MADVIPNPPADVNDCSAALEWLWGVYFPDDLPGAQRP